ncbi:pyrroline-5-carboxylate reductase dimerization-domain-containing protein, partial [Leptodontidium sp. MPI-SDFR-AT-0119]
MAPSKVLTVAIIGCGSIGTAIASGILDASSVDGNIPESEVPIRISRVIATVETNASRQRVLSSLSQHSQKVDVRLKSENMAALQEADVILFSIKPIKRGEILTEPAAREALRGKLLISVMGGINTSVLHTAINGDGAPSDSDCQIVRVMPNLAAQIRQAVSLGTSIPGQLTPENSKITEWILSQVGDFQFIPETHFDIASVLVGCSGSLIMLAIDGLLDAAVAEGLKRSEAQPLLVKSIIGLLGLLTTGGGHPSVTREKISSPGGNSIQALLEL